MTPTPSPLHASVTSARQRAGRAEAIKQAWQAGQLPDAAAALAEDPDLAADRAAALDLAYEEFCVREEAGEAPDAAAFCARFAFGASLQRLLTLHRFFDEHPDVLATAPTVWPSNGEVVGDFQTVRELGRGSFARAYLAVESTAGRRPVALKVSAAGSREADTLGPLAHPNLVPVLSARPVGAWTVVAMPYAGTATLEDALLFVRASSAGIPRSASLLLAATTAGAHPDDPPFPSRPAPAVRADMTHEDAVTAVAAGVFAGVAYLHEQGIAHRDLKPSNVLLAPGGHPYLLDLNLASRAADPWRLAGTLPYMAPEQLATFAGGTAPTDPRPGDVFACGVLLFELLTGKHPFGVADAPGASFDRDRTAAELLTAQRAGSPNLRALNPRVGRAARDAVLRCLAPDPDARPTAAELAELFARAAAPRSRRFAVPALAGCGVVALALGFAAFRGPNTAPVEPQPVAAVAPAPAVPATPFERGLESMRKGEFGVAASDFREVGKANQDGRAYGFAAYCLSAGKADPEAVLVVADEAIRLGYHPAPVYANRAYNHFKRRDLAKAKLDCEKAIHLDSKLPAPRYTRAFIGLQLHFAGKSLPPEAVTDVKLAAEGMPDSPEVWYTAAQIYAIASAGNAALKHDAAWAVRNAVQTGKDRETIKRTLSLKSALAGFPAYDEALTLTPDRPASSADPHLALPTP